MRVVNRLTGKAT